MIYEASNYMEGIEDHFQANQLLFISVSDPDPDLNPLFWQHWYQLLINLTNYDTIRKIKDILKVDPFIVMLNSVDYVVFFWPFYGLNSDPDPHCLMRIRNTSFYNEFKFLKINSIQLKKIHTGGIPKGL